MPTQRSSKPSKKPAKEFISKLKVEDLVERWQQYNLKKTPKERPHNGI